MVLADLPGTLRLPVPVPAAHPVRHRRLRLDVRVPRLASSRTASSRRQRPRDHHARRRCSKGLDVPSRSTAPASSASSWSVVSERHGSSRRPGSPSPSSCSSSASWSRSSCTSPNLKAMDALAGEAGRRRRRPPATAGRRREVAELQERGKKAGMFGGLLHLIFLLLLIDMIWKPGSSEPQSTCRLSPVASAVVHPIERLRYVARASGAAQACSCRRRRGARLVRRRSAGPGHGLPAHRLAPAGVGAARGGSRPACSPPATRIDEIVGGGRRDRGRHHRPRARPRAARRRHGGRARLARDASARRWPRRGDLEVLVVDTLGEGSGLVRRLLARRLPTPSTSR